MRGGDKPSASRVLGYARVSSVEQSVGSSLQDQQDAIVRYAQTLGLSVSRMFVEAESGVGEKLERRIEVQSLMKQVRRGDLILVDKIDRWSRDPEFTYRSVREILAAGANVYFVGDVCDPSTHDGDTMLGFRAVMAREEHKRIKQRLVGTRKLLRNRGYFADGLAPYGYRRKGGQGLEKNVLVPHEEEAANVRRMFRMAIEGHSVTSIAAALVTTRDRVFAILRNRMLLGEVRDGSGAWIRGRHDAIIDAKTFADAREAMASRNRKGRRPTADAAGETTTWWLRDVARCALCGARMSSAYAGPRDARRYYFACSHRCISSYVNVRKAEAECDPLVMARLLELREALASSGAEKAKRQVDSDAVKAKLERLGAKRSRYLEAFADGAMNRDELRSALAKLDDERTRLDASLLAPRVATSEEKRSALRNVEALRRAWTKARPEERRIIVRGLAKAALLAAGQPARFEWFTTEEIARKE